MVDFVYEVFWVWVLCLLHTTRNIHLLFCYSICAHTHAYRKHKIHWNRAHFDIGEQIIEIIIINGFCVCVQICVAVLWVHIKKKERKRKRKRNEKIVIDNKVKRRKIINDKQMMRARRKWTKKMLGCCLFVWVLLRVLNWLAPFGFKKNWERNREWYRMDTVSHWVKHAFSESTDNTIDTTIASKSQNDQTKKKIQIICSKLVVVLW